MMTSDGDEALTLNEAADRAGVHPQTMKRWLSTGQVEGWRRGGKKLGWRVRRSVLQDYLTRIEAAGKGLVA